MNITGEQEIYVYGDVCEPIPAAEMRCRSKYIGEKLDEGFVVIRLIYNKNRQINDITAYALTPSGDIYVGDIIPTLTSDGYCIAENWREEIYLPSEIAEAVDHWTSDHGYVEWYETNSHDFFENLDGPALTDFLDEFLKLNPDYTVEGCEDYYD